MPFDFGTCWKAFKLGYGEGPDPRRFVGLTLLVIFGPGVYVFNALCLWLDKLLYPDFLKVEIKAPVFIVGNARSGTTFMHRLMCEDNRRFTYFKAWELFWPSLIQKKVIRALGRADARLLGGAIEKAIKRFEDKAFERFRDLHPLSLTGSEEDETLMVHIFFSPFINILFPYLKDLEYLQWFDQLPEAKRREVMTFYRECVQRQLYLDGGGKVLCSKNPIFTTKMASLREAFPDARFVYMVRNPYETIPSLQNMLYTVWKSAWCDVSRDGEAVRTIGENSIKVYQYAQQLMASWPEEVCAAVRYDDLVSDPRGTVEKVYAHFGMEVDAELATVLQQEAEKARAYKSKHSYSLEEFGLSREKIRAELAEVFERYGWTA